MRKYEIVFITNPEKTDEQVASLTEEIKAVIEKEGGEVEHVEQWGKRKLAYTVKKNRYGHYTLLHATMPAESVSKLETSFKYSEAVIKYITLTHDPRSALRPTQEESSGSYYNRNAGDRR